MSQDPTAALCALLRGIVGRRHVFTRPRSTRPYAQGYRMGSGPVAAVVRPGTLPELWQVLQACVGADHIVIPQAANTGLTGGSTPDGLYDRPVVLVNVQRLKGIHPVLGGRQAICLPGATLDELERALVPLGREPHSVIGSSCIGASVIGGVCNNSGGALVRRGPAYTEYALYARVGESGDVQLVNHLGVDLGDSPEAMLRALQEGAFGEHQVRDEPRAASSPAYGDTVRDVDAPTPARFNCDPRHLHEASGCAGRLVVFAVRLDTFPADPGGTTFYIGSNDPGELGGLRRALLQAEGELPISCEYIHRGAFDLADRYGKDTFLAIRHLGTRRLPKWFGLKNRIDRWARALRILPEHFSDRLLQAAGRMFPDHLPPRLRSFRDRFEHHLVLKVPGTMAQATSALLARNLSSGGAFFECTPREASAAFLHRFAVASAAIRHRAVHPRETSGLIALDIALRRNDRDWFERLPEDVSRALLPPIYYGHFLCHVFHQDYLVRAGFDPAALEARMLELLDARGAEYPAEHNVGHHYRARPALAKHYRALDPGNRLNPGLGLTSRKRGWR